MSDWNFLNKNRAWTALLPHTDASWGFNGYFLFALPGEARKIKCIASDGGGWQHVSVSFPEAIHKVPSWELMCRIKDLFWEEEDVVIQIHPPRSQHVNEHPGCLHLWRCTCAPQPLPPSILVGVIGRTEKEVLKMTDQEILEEKRRRMAEEM